MGDVKPWLWEKPMFHHLCCLSPFVSSNLVNLFNASAGGWGVMAEWLRAFIAGENVGKEASNSSIFPTTPFFPWSVALTASLFFLMQRSVCPPYGLLIRAQRVRLFPLTRRRESSCRNRLSSLRFVGCGVQFRFGPLCVRGEPFSAGVCV